MNTEIRGGVPAEIRENQSGGIDVMGYAAVYGERADIGGMFHEEIERGAFAEAVNRDDVVFLINHGGLPLARTRSGTLKLTEDDHGLRMKTTLDADDPDVQSIISKMKRGDLDKMSFAFRMEGGKEEWDDSGDIPVRIIKRIGSLHDVAIVTTPAYEGTEIGLRGLEQHRSNQTKSKNFSAAQRRLRMKVDLDLRSKMESKA